MPNDVDGRIKGNWIFKIKKLRKLINSNIKEKFQNQIRNIFEIEITLLIYLYYKAHVQT